MSKLTLSSKLLTLFALTLISGTALVSADKEVKPEKTGRSADDSKQALRQFMRVQMPKKDASDGERVAALTQKMEIAIELLPMLDEWKTRVTDAKNLSDENRKDFDGSISKITKESIQAAMDDLKAAKPNFDKATAVNKSIITCHRIAEKTKAGIPKPVKATTSTEVVAEPAPAEPKPTVDAAPAVSEEAKPADASATPATATA